MLNLFNINSQEMLIEDKGSVIVVQCDYYFVFTCKIIMMCTTSVYSQTSMAQTSLGPWKLVLDMGTSSH